MKHSKAEPWNEIDEIETDIEIRSIAIDAVPQNRMSVANSNGRKPSFPESSRSPVILNQQEDRITFSLWLSCFNTQIVKTVERLVEIDRIAEQAFNKVLSNALHRKTK